MDGFTYTNIFETKAIEYLAVVFFFVLLIPFWSLMNGKVKPAGRGQTAPGLITADALRIPQGIFFSKFHTWAHLEKSGDAKVGLDDLMFRITGEVTFEQIKKPGEKINKGELLSHINYNGNTLRLLSPISGEVKTANSILSEKPWLIKNDPYLEGWIYTIKPTNWKDDTDSHYLAENATTWAIRELERFKDFLSVSSMKMMPEPMGAVLQDGGEIIEKPLAKLPQEVWKEFQNEFLT